VEESGFSSQIAGDLVNYRIYLPPCFGLDGRTYPAVYFFHGSAQTDSHWDDLGVDEAAEILIKGGLAAPFLIVMPNGGEIAQETSGGPSSFEELVVEELVPHIEENYCAWSAADGRALGGLSRGGYWALEIAFRNPRMFAGVGGHSAALFDAESGSEVDPLITVKDAAISDMGIYLDVGSDDYVLEKFHELHELLVEIGKEHLWLVNEGSHQDSYWRSHLAGYLMWYSESWPLERSQYPACPSGSLER
jgi:enterochelin esterase-like enzyme